MTEINKLLWLVGKKENFERIKDLLEMLSINYAVIKGEALSLQAYGKVGQRIYSDIDILVSIKNLHHIDNVLKKFGFIGNEYERSKWILLLSNSHQILPYTLKMYPWPDLLLDINFDILWGEYEGTRIDIESFLSDTIDVEIYGVRVKTLSPLKAMIQLILHHYKDMNSIFLLATRKCIKYDIFKDVYHLLKNNLHVISIDKLYTMSAKYEIIPYVFYVLYYTGQVFDDEILKQYIEAFRTPEGEGLLNCYGLCTKERKEWKCDFETRFKSEDLYLLMKDDLTDDDLRKISINKSIFLGGAE